MAGGLERPPRRIGRPDEWVLHDGPTPCGYLADHIARIPLRLPVRPLTPEESAERLRLGDRRQGLLLYQPACPGCRACEAIRLPVAAFQPSRAQRRAFRQGEALLDVSTGPPATTPEKVALYNRHKLERDLALGDDLLDEASYHELFVESCVDTLEIEYRHGERLVGVALVDLASDALSAVYTYFDPAVRGVSIGTYSILKQIEFCRQLDLPYLYLGLWVAGSPPMQYKLRFRPHQRRIDGQWRDFD